MAKQFSQLAIPSIITSLIGHLYMTINTIFAGRMATDSVTKMAGVGLGNMFLAMFS